jgi:hypothetical protein
VLRIDGKVLEIESHDLESVPRALDSQKSESEISPKGQEAPFSAFSFHSPLFLFSSRKETKAEAEKLKERTHKSNLCFFI